MKKNIAVIAGGFSGEYEISINSAKMIIDNIDKGMYNPYLIVITHDKWVHFNKSNEEFQVDKNDFTVKINNRKIIFHCVFNIIHGTPGEDGKLQGYFDMLNITYTSSNACTSALTFNKAYCNYIVKSLDVSVPKSVHLIKHNQINSKKIVQEIALPAFVKPCNGGSSVGTSMVKNNKELEEAIDQAFKYDDEVLVEEYINGTEITCGIFRFKNQLMVFPITEIVSKNEFFDYEAKYSSGKSEEITPARISDEVAKFCASTTSYLYNKLNCRGVVRIDYIVTKSKKLYFLEVNTVPGMSEMSIVPQQARHFGLKLSEFISMIIEDAIYNKKNK
jgi:D-alanine-D-alanine ligase